MMVAQNVPGAQEHALRLAGLHGRQSLDDINDMVLPGARQVRGLFAEAFQAKIGQGADQRNAGRTKQRGKDNRPGDDIKHRAEHEEERQVDEEGRQRRGHKHGE